MFAKYSERSLIRGLAGTAVVSLIASLMACVPQTATGQTPQTTGSTASEVFKLSGRILKSSGNSDIYVELWRAEGFLEKPVLQIRIKPGETPDFRFEVPAGRWAVSAFEDTNGNRILDQGVFGPKEPCGFWHTFKGWRKPGFEDVSSSIHNDTSGADITLK